ncbi:MAG: hypothetical protein ABSG76_25720, partial [Xanthobacteraceae bacterium]
MAVRKSGGSDEPGGAGEGSQPDQAQAAPPATAASSAVPAPPDEFRSFLVALATDPAKLGAFIKDPDGSMGAADIDPVDQAILKSGQAWMIHSRLLGQKFSFTPPPPTTVLVVDMTRQAGAGGPDAVDQPTVRSNQAVAAAPPQGSSAMFPNFPNFP